MKKQGRKSDVYSFGLLMWEIATQIAPWCDENAALVSDLVRQGLRPSLNGIDKGAPGWFVPLIEQCWSQDPEERPTFIHISETFQTGILLPVAKNVVEVEPTIKRLKESEEPIKEEEDAEEEDEEEEREDDDMEKLCSPLKEKS